MNKDISSPRDCKQERREVSQSRLTQCETASVIVIGHENMKLDKYIFEYDALIKPRFIKVSNITLMQDNIQNQ